VTTAQRRCCARAAARRGAAELLLCEGLQLRMLNVLDYGNREAFDVVGANRMGASER